MAGVLLLSAAACLGPAIRASLVDPANALRKG
jgi:ABC-type lipoprotein release transport system permease subunit